MSRTPAHIPVHPSNHSSILWFSSLAMCSFGLIKQGAEPSSSQIWTETENIPVCTEATKMKWERKKKDICGRSRWRLTSLLTSRWVWCLCVRVWARASSEIHHPICQQRPSSALSHTKNWLRAPLIGLNVAAIRPYSSVSEGASQAWSIGLPSALKPMWTSSHYVGAIGPSGGNLWGAYREN